MELEHVRRVVTLSGYDWISGMGELVLVPCNLNFVNEDLGNNPIQLIPGIE